MRAVRSGQGPIKPGESDSVTVIVDTLGKEGRFSNGARVFTNDPEKRDIVFLIKANVVADEE